ncbi:MAG TPA: protoporphyrinogen oxidase HemJ [Steroidobacteraceae bacterium]|nr:protoporphyrinogen oxidase HemJ [Steroidobacteraceae bacterium]
MLLLWLKAFHVIAVVTWFAGLFYLPRLFVYHAETRDAIGLERFKIMERRLLKLTTIGACASLGFGVAMLWVAPAYITMGWLHFKLMLVGVLIVYHLYCYKFTRQFARDHNVHSPRWYRLFNEVPSLLLIGIVILAVVKP